MSSDQIVCLSDISMGVSNFLMGIAIILVWRNKNRESIWDGLPPHLGGYVAFLFSVMFFSTSAERFCEMCSTDLLSSTMFTIVKFIAAVACLPAVPAFYIFHSRLLSNIAGYLKVKNAEASSETYKRKSFQELSTHGQPR